jgi:hypothetical protein
MPFARKKKSNCSMKFMLPVTANNVARDFPHESPAFLLLGRNSCSPPSTMSQLDPRQQLLGTETLFPVLSPVCQYARCRLPCATPACSNYCHQQSGWLAYLRVVVYMQKSQLQFLNTDLLSISRWLLQLWLQLLSEMFWFVLSRLGEQGRWSIKLSWLAKRRT